MAIVTNFDELKNLHSAAIIGGAKSRAWIEFAVTMIDSFPKLYAKAKAMNEHLDCVQKQIASIQKEVKR